MAKKEVTQENPAVENAVKTEIIETLKKTGREGIEDLDRKSVV